MDKATSLYRYYGSSGDLLYVGITSTRTLRSLQHANDKAWWGEVARAEYEHLEGRQEALRRELDVIRSEKPKYNVAGKGHRDRPSDSARDYGAEAMSWWPDGMDAVDAPRGHGTWATVSWCGPLSVMLWPSYTEADNAYGWMSSGGCGHACEIGMGGDHQLIPLFQPEEISAGLERARMDYRISHFEACVVCDYVYSGQAADAARRRHARRVSRATA